jgi:hypothetical protein
MHLNAMENQAMKKRGERLYGNGELPYKFHFYTPLDSNDQQLNCEKDSKKLEDLCPFWNLDGCAYFGRGMLAVWFTLTCCKK